MVRLKLCKLKLSIPKLQRINKLSNLVLSRYTYRTGDAIMNNRMDCCSTYLLSLFKNFCKEITLSERKRVALIMYENYICQYKALLLQCEQEFKLVMNSRLFKNSLFHCSQSSMVNLRQLLYLMEVLPKCLINCGRLLS